MPTNNIKGLTSELTKKLLEVSDRYDEMQRDLNEHKRTVRYLTAENARLHYELESRDQRDV